PLDRQRLIGAQDHALRDQRSQAIEIAVRNRPIEQPFRRIDAQVVRGVDDVDDKRPLDDVAADAEIEVAERRWAGKRQRWRHQQGQDERNLTYQADSLSDKIPASYVAAQLCT